MEIVSSLCGCDGGWDLVWLLGVLIVLSTAGAWLAAILVPDFFWLGYGVVGKRIHVRLLHVLPIYTVPISNIRDIRFSTEGTLPGNPITWLFWFEITRPYAVISFKRQIFGGLMKQVQITPFRAHQFVAKVRAQLDQANRRTESAPPSDSRNHRSTKHW